MANMSYCRFQNTYGDLQDCTNVLGKALDEGTSYECLIDNLSGDEIRALFAMVKEAKRFIKYYDELNEG